MAAKSTSSSPAGFRLPERVATWDEIRPAGGVTTSLDEGVVVEEDTPAEVFSLPREPRTKEFLRKVL